VFLFVKSDSSKKLWIPAFAGMTKLAVFLGFFSHQQALFQHPAKFKPRRIKRKGFSYSNFEEEMK